jgi:hypothetical protein
LLLLGKAIDDIDFEYISPDNIETHLRNYFNLRPDMSQDSFISDFCFLHKNNLYYVHDISKTIDKHNKNIDEINKSKSISSLPEQSISEYELPLKGINNFFPDIFAYINSISAPKSVKELSPFIFLLRKLTLLDDYFLEFNTLKDARS